MPRYVTAAIMAIASCVGCGRLGKTCCVLPSMNKDVPGIQKESSKSVSMSALFFGKTVDRRAKQDKR